jgi:hypothetical protein
MGWIKVSGKVLEYAGKIDQTESFEEWAQQEGKALIEKVALEQGFKVFRETKAKKILWKELQLAAASDALRAAFQDEVNDYQKIPGKIASKASYLPRSGGYPSVVAVPRFMINLVALDNIRAHLGIADELARLSGESMKEYLFLQLVREMDKTLAGILPSSKNPFPSDGNWLFVGFDENYQWRQDTDLGHYLLCEPTEGKITRSDQKDVEDKISNLESSLGKMSLEEKEKFISPFFKT